MRARLFISFLCALGGLGCGGQTRQDGQGSAASGGSGAVGGTMPGGGSGGQGGTAASGGTGAMGGSPNCQGPNPAGCVQNACPPNAVCDTSVGCAPSSCACTSDGWACTADCNGGTCVPITPNDCNSIAASIAEQTKIQGSCTAVVRLDYLTRAVISHMFFCGQYVTTTEAAARATAQADTGFGNGELLSGPNPTDAWVFYTQPGDFGGVSAVSAHTGVSVFGGGIVWAGQGDVVYPPNWNTYEIGHDCPPFPMPTARGFDLANASPLAPQELNSSLDVVAKTAVPAGLAAWGSLLDAVVLLYPRSVGIVSNSGFDPKTTELVVILNAGILE